MIANSLRHNMPKLTLEKNRKGITLRLLKPSMKLSATLLIDLLRKKNCENLLSEFAA